MHINALDNSASLDHICKLLFDSASEALIVTDKSGNIQLINPSTESMFGYKSDELIGEKVETLLPDELRRKHQAHRKNYYSKPSKRAMGIGMDLLGQKKDGSTFPVEVSLNHFSLKGDQMVMALVSDISTRKEAENRLQRFNESLEQKVRARTQALKDNQRLYKVIARNFPNGVINVLDEQLNYLFVEGKEMYEMGITSKMLLGTSFIKRLHPSIRPQVKEKLLEVFKGKNTNFELQLAHNTYLVNAVGLPNLKNEIKQVLLVIINISKQKKAEDDIRSALEKEKHLNELKSRFVSMASHEFRTPLTAIMNSISLLLKYTQLPQTEEKQLKHINSIKSSVYDLLNILDDFISFDKLENNKVELNYSEIKINEFSAKVINDLNGLVKNEQKIVYAHQGKSRIKLDQQLLKHTLGNLLTNAIKYSEEKALISLKTTVENDKLKVEVEDNGIGIPKEEQHHLFKRFFRAKNVMHIQGTGLGLNIVKEYVDQAKGKIYFESEYGKGSTFTVEIPLNEQIE